MVLVDKLEEVWAAEAEAEDLDLMPTATLATRNMAQAEQDLLEEF